MQQSEALATLKSGHNVFLTGSAGAGKTYVLNQYIDYCRQSGVPVAITAATGIAATHIGGTTIHAWSGIGIRDHIDQAFLSAQVKKAYLKKQIKPTQVLVIDEISMLSPNVIDMVDAVVRAFKRNTQPFGGMQVIFAGDFFQLPPVQSSRERHQEEWLNETRFAWSSNSWQQANLTCCYLTEQHRQNDDQLLGILNDIRCGSVSQLSLEQLQSRLDVKPDESAQPVIKLFTHNQDTRHLNNRQLATMPGDAHTYPMRSFGQRGLLDRFKNTVTKIIPETLALKKNAQVIFTKNNYEAGYLNGTLGQVMSFKGPEALPVVRLRSGKTITVEPQSWHLEEDGKVVAELAQLPLNLAWAITVHKSQGMSLEAAEIDLSKAFEPGQGYVALSRLTDLSGLFLLGLNQRALEVDPVVLEQDHAFQRLARQTQSQLKTLDKATLEAGYADTLKRFGGRPAQHSDSAEESYASSHADKKGDTFEQTYALIQEGKDLETIAEERSIQLTTVYKHLHKLSDQGKDLNMACFRPSVASVLDVEKCIKDLKAEGRDEYFTDRGVVRLKAVHQALSEIYSYDELNTILAFIQPSIKQVGA